MLDAIKEIIKTWKEGLKEVDLKETLKDLGLDALEALAFSTIAILKQIALKTETPLDDEIVKKLEAWADKINPKVDRVK